MIRVLLVEPMNLLRGALTAALSEEEDFSVVGGRSRLAEAVDLARAVPPDVAVVNVGLLTGDGLRLLARLGCATLVVAGPEARARVNRALDMPVGGVVSTDAGPADLARAIRRLMRGERVIDAGLAVAMVAAPRSPLSERELHVLSVAASGVPAAEVAATLNLTAGTVRNYISVILRKTGARNRLEAVRLAEHAGWLQ
ncbi:DNA-binding response regulator [Paractinoplanes abujensis]|uniref:Two-component system response regulator DesR n=1 Tax=Paractinoplanes abujensis TaxID=882441 RepID=A0A7W7G1Q0_9ACTN|nr:response regulator transcription factor [Actinoplanes abujensis]MBB4692859.1 two-component system response regulator DesR [Actinoplanes abujensis]GID22641.1 DNA-binding response regulator [Actinoplanes abujensis]